MEQTTEMNNERIYGKIWASWGKTKGKLWSFKQAKTRRSALSFVVYLGGRCFEYDGGESKTGAFDYVVESRQGLSGDFKLTMKILCFFLSGEDKL